VTESISPQKSAYQFKDEVKLWFDLNKVGSLYTKIKSSDYVKLYYNHHLQRWKDNNFIYLFGGFSSNKIYRSFDVRLGVGYVSDTTNV
jgi:hypothetical protein